MRPRSSGRAATVSIVVPVLNEARNLEVILPQLPKVHQVVLVDGRSVDDTVATARRIMPDITVVTQTRRGKGNALACGFEAATGDIIVMFDADCSADPREIPAFVDALLDGADFAKGSRYVRGGGSQDLTILRSAGNRALNGLANTLMRTRYTDLCYGYNAFWRDILPELALPETVIDGASPDTKIWGDGFEIETLLACRVTAAKLDVAEVPSVELPRMYGDSNLNTFRDGARVLRTIVAEQKAQRSAAPRVTEPASARSGRPALEVLRGGAETSTARSSYDRRPRHARPAYSRPDGEQARSTGGGGRGRLARGQAVVGAAPISAVEQE